MESHSPPDAEAAASESNMSSQDCTAEQSEHPWPYLATLFEFIGVSGTTYRFKCISCLPKVTECAAYCNSPSNLKKHMTRMHPSLVEQYVQLSTGARKRKHPGAQDSGPAKKVKQETIAGIFCFFFIHH